MRLWGLPEPELPVRQKKYIPIGIFSELPFQQFINIVIWFDAIAKPPHNKNQPRANGAGYHH